MLSDANTRVFLVRNQSAWGPKAERAFRAALESEDGPEILSTATGEEAVALAAEKPADLVIADLVLPKPGFSGLYTLVRIRELCPDCRSIVVSDHDYVESLLGQVADAFLIRSPHPRSTALGLQLVSVAHELLGHHRPAPRPVAAIPSQISTIVDEPSSDPRPTAGLIAGKYRLGAKLGEGGMGEVYRAEDTFIQRQVAIKLLRVQPSAHKAGERRRRMHREVMIAGRLQHPNIVTVHDAGFNGPDLYLVMALIDGETLRHLLADQSPLPPARALTIILEILDALSYAHCKGIVHRDLKPSNVLMTREGGVKVADFGLAKIRSMALEVGDVPPSEVMRDLTDDGAVLGTLGYMAPEQMLGKPSDPRSDLFSLGAMLFEMLHGQPLARFRPTARLAACLQLGRQQPEIPTLDRHPELDRILNRSIALEAGDRYQTCSQLSAELRSLGS